MECMVCGHGLAWQNDFMASEVGLTESEDPQDDCIISLWSCGRCGTEYEIRYPSENEKKNYEYYDEP